MLIYVFFAVLAVILGLVCSFVLYPVVYMFHTIVVAPIYGMHKRKQGDYKTVIAKIDLSSISTFANAQGDYLAAYDYSVDGKDYRTIISQGKSSSFVDEICLYYLDNPNKAVERVDSLGKIENPKGVRRVIWIITAIILFIIFVFIWVMR